MSRPTPVSKRHNLFLMCAAAVLVALGVGFMPAQVFSNDPVHASDFMALMSGICIGFGGSLAIAIVAAPKELGNDTLPGSTT